MKTSLVIPNYNNPSLLKQCLESLINRETYSNYDVCVVDDGSEAHHLKSVEQLIERAGKHIKIKLIKHDTNKGFSQAVNTGINNTDGDIVVLVNSDIVFLKPFIEPMLDAFGMDEKVAVVGGVLMYPDYRVQHAGVQIMPNGWWGHNGLNTHFNAANPLFKSNFFPGVTGALMGIRRKSISDIGLFSTDYVGAYEDVEYCMRVWEKGYKIWMDQRIQALHLEGVTRGKNVSDKMTKNPYMWYREQISMKKLSKKMTPRLMKILDETLQKARGRS